MLNDQPRVARKITFFLFIAQSLASAGFIAVATVNSILGSKLGGSSAWAGVPSAVFLLGGALAASIWGVLMDKLGRRYGIGLGLLIGVGGALSVVHATNLSSMGWMLFGMAVLGIANSAMVLGRFAAAEVNLPEKRGAAISNVVLGGTFGAIFGPMLVAPMGVVMLSAGMDELSGAYIANGILLVVASLLIFIGLKPEPRDYGRLLATNVTETQDVEKQRSIWEVFLQPGAITAVAAMVFGQMVMVAVMVITSLHMKDHNHMLGDISMVISSHTFGMYAFSVLSGRLADKWGRGVVISIGAGVLLLSCLTAPISPDVLPLAVSLFLLGLGWNFCFVGGSTLLADQLRPEERGRAQGVNDFLVGLASATGSLSSGVIFSGFGYGLVAAIGAIFSLIPLFLALRLIFRARNALEMV